MNLFLTLGLSALLALCFGGGAGVQSEFTPVCWLHFRAAVRAGREPGTTDLHIIFSLEEEDICRDTHLLDQQLDWSNSGLRPLLLISTCPTRGRRLVNDTIVHTLITTLEQMRTNTSNFRRSDSIIELPPYLNTGCVKLIIRESNVGTGAVIPELRVRFGSIPRQNVISESLFPQCIGTGANYAGEYASWVVLDRSASCEEGKDTVRFVPIQVHFITEDEFFITGNGLVYSPNQGDIFYQLLLPVPIVKINQFVASGDFKTYAAIITSLNVGMEMWLGFSGNLGVIRLYPSPLLGHFQTSEDSTLVNMLEDNVTLVLTHQNELFLSRGNAEYHIPVPALVSFYLFSLDTSSSCPSALLNRHSLDLFTSGFSPLTLCPTRQCPFASVTLEARVCGDITRSYLHFTVGDQLVQQLETFPEQNCMLTGNDLPRDIYLERLDTYNITVTFQLLGLGEPTDLQFVVWASDPVNLNITIDDEFTDDGSRLRYEVLLAESGLLTGQYSSGYDISLSSIELEVPGIALQCVNPLSRFIRLPGSYRSRVHIGCPPGLSLLFDPHTTSSRGRYSQYCTPRDHNISCFHFINVFYPAFLIGDDITGQPTIYTGRYTLRLVAGGKQADDMTTFDRSRNIEDGVWSPVNTLPGGVHHNGSGVRWVCASGSPCGELLPGVGYLPRYYFLVEASNSGVMENRTYCDLSVQFLIELHGMPMGTVTALIVLIFWLFVLSVLILVMFVLWSFRQRLTRLVDPVSGWLSDMWRQESRKEWLVKEVRRRASATKPLPFVQLQAEDDFSASND